MHDESRSARNPFLILSQDYELFFWKSGSIEKCLIEPTNALLTFAKQHGVAMTFFVDAGMLHRMQEVSRYSSEVGRMSDSIRRNLETIAGQGHEIGLHIHPHWIETKWTGDQWDFSGTRYRLSDFSASEAAQIINEYASTLRRSTEGVVRSYRAGGFCIEPFEHVSEALRNNGIDIDSSVLQGAMLRDPDKGFDFRPAPKSSWWRFTESPLKPAPEGAFLEIPVNTVRLPVFHYWGRLFERVTGRRAVEYSGDGSPKKIGKLEILRRLAGAGRISELSSDAPKAMRLRDALANPGDRPIWQVMGHPKLVGPTSIENLSRLLRDHQFARVGTLAQIAESIGSGSAPDH